MRIHTECEEGSFGLSGKAMELKLTRVALVLMTEISWLGEIGMGSPGTRGPGNQGIRTLPRIGIDNIFWVTGPGGSDGETGSPRGSSLKALANGRG
jgi:hypothetical protein